MINTNLYTKKGNPRKRKPKQDRDYFNQATEDAILKYVSLSPDDIEEKNKVYNRYIAYSFFKLAENIINTFGFDYRDGETITDLIQECTELLLNKLHLYKQEKGKAYSYFGTIIKRHCIVWNKKNYKKLQQQSKLEEVDSDSDDESKRQTNMLSDEPTPIDISEFFKIYVAHVDDNLETLFPKQKDLKVADAVMELFRKCDSLEIFEKKALYIYLREMLGDVDTPQITKIVNKLKDTYKSLYSVYYENDTINI